MGCCSCKIQWGQMPDSEPSHVLLKITEEDLTKPIEKPSPDRYEEISTVKPEFISISGSPFKLNSEPSKLDLTMTFRHNADVIQQGELSKYRPGFTNQFVSRWCVLNAECFMYFKNRGSAQIWDQPPLFSVSLSSIKAVKKVNFKIPGVVQKSEQFEIFLKTEGVDIEVSREADKTPIMKSLFGKTAVSDEKDSVVKGCLMKRPIRNEIETTDNAPIYAERSSWSVREVEWFAAEKRLLFIAEGSLERDFWILNIMKACKNLEERG